MTLLPGNDITRITNATSWRASSWDRTGQNMDCVELKTGETMTIMDVAGAGSLNHIYFTIIGPDPMDYRDMIIRMYWDGEDTPSVEVPFGDFFCVPNCTVKRFASLMMAVNLGMADKEFANNGYNCYFRMPFNNGARVTLENQSSRSIGGTGERLWYHLDYELQPDPHSSDVGRFHAQWRRENPTVVSEAMSKVQWFEGVNLDGKDNYVMLEAEGQGHIAGLFLQVNNLAGSWWGEGDDMIFIDGVEWPPHQHGTGSEEVFGGGAGPDKEYAGPYTGFLQVENLNAEKYKGMNAMYRWYLQDPIRFQKSVKMTIEHGHSNNRANDYTSVAYWYQHEPHAPFPTLPNLEARRPIMPDGYYDVHERCLELANYFVPLFRGIAFEGEPKPDWFDDVMNKHGEAFSLMHEYDFDAANKVLDEAFALLPSV